MNWTVGSCNVFECIWYPGLPDVCCPPPPRRWMSALAAPCPRPARPQLSWLKTTTTNSPRPARPPADCKFYCHFAENPSGFPGMIRSSFEGDMGNVRVFLNHLFFQLHIVSPDAPKVCELSGEAVVCLHQQPAPAPGHWGWNSHVGAGPSSAVPPHRHAGQQHTAELMRKTVHNVCQCFATLHTVILVTGRPTLPRAGTSQLACCHVSTVAVIRAVKGEGEREVARSWSSRYAESLCTHTSCSGKSVGFSWNMILCIFLQMSIQFLLFAAKGRARFK